MGINGIKNDFPGSVRISTPFGTDGENELTTLDEDDNSDVREEDIYINDNNGSWNN